MDWVAHRLKPIYASTFLEIHGKVTEKTLPRKVVLGIVLFGGISVQNMLKKCAKYALV